jgi:REP element-mobilizing transposase RayT
MEFEQLDKFIENLKSYTAEKIKILDHHLIKKNSDVWNMGFLILSKGEYLEPHILAYLNQLTDSNSRSPLWEKFQNKQPKLIQINRSITSIRFLIIFQTSDQEPYFKDLVRASMVKKIITQYFKRGEEKSEEEEGQDLEFKDKLKEMFRDDFQDLPTSYLQLLDVSVEADNAWLEIQIDQNFADGMSIPKLINSLKSVTARYIAKMYPELKSDESGVWNPGYFIITKGSFLERYIDQYLDQLISLIEIM